MKTRNLARTEVKVSRIAYGVGMLRTDWRSPDFIARSIQAIHTAYEHGITLFDTADIYAWGESEGALGKFLRQSPQLRDKVVIQSKCGFRIRADWTHGDPLDVDTLFVELDRSRIIAAVEGSLKRLGTDRLDVLLLHGPSSLVEPEEVAQAFEDLHRSGKVLQFGLCQHTVAQIELLQKWVRQRLVVNQIWLGLARHAPISDTGGFGSLVDYCRLHDIQVQAFSPLKRNDMYERPVLLEPPAGSSPELVRLVELLRTIARRHDATPAAIMLAWLLRHPAGIIPIIGASHPAHIAENSRADEIELSVAEWESLIRSALRIWPS